LLHKERNEGSQKLKKFHAKFAKMKATQRRVASCQNVAIGVFRASLREILLRQHLFNMPLLLKRKSKLFFDNLFSDNAVIIYYL
jgi:hypothetical protein